MPAPLPADFFDGSAPIALVASDSSFIGPQLCKELTTLGVKVILQNVNEDLQDEDFFQQIKKVDYIFCLAWGGGFSTQNVSRLLDFSEEKNARFLFATDFKTRVDEKDALALSQTEKKSQDIRFIRLLDVFGPGMEAERGIVGQTLRQAGDFKPLVIPGNHEELVYPVPVRDVVLGLIKAQMTPGTKGLVATLAGHKTTAYNFAQEVKRAHSSGQAREELEITFKETTSKRDLDEAEVERGTGQLSWQPEENLGAALAETLSWLAANKGVAPAPKPTEKKAAGFWDGGVRPKTVDSPKRFKKRFLALPLAALGIVFWFFVLPAVQLGIGLAEFNYAQKQAKEGNNQKAGEWFATASFWFDLSRQSFLSWGALPGLKNEAVSLSGLSKLLLRVAAAEEQGAVLAQKGESLKANIVSKESYQLAEKIQDLQAEINSQERELGFLEAELKDTNLDSKIPFFPDLRELVNTVARNREQVSFFGQLLSILPELLGQDAKKTYLVLLQDNSELRASGGTVKAIAFLSFEKGRLVNLEVKGIEAVDSQLKGQIEAPEPLNKYLGLTSWNLENSGWSADFATSASRAAWFITKELEQKVDGVISFDLEFVKSRLEAAGKLELENGEVVNSANIYQKAQTGAKDFFTLMHRAVLESLLTPTQSAFDTHLLGLAKGKHLSFWSTQPKVQTVFVKQGLDGGVRTVTCQSAVQFENCLTDYLQVVDANLGKNRISRLVEKAHSLEIDIKSGALVHKMTVTLENKVVTDPYKSYLRLYVPATAALSLAAEVNPTTGEQTTLATEASSDRGKRTFGVFVQIPPGEKRQLVFLWDVPTVAQTVEKEGELVFLWQKQQGTASSPYALRINLPGTDLRVGAYPVPSLTDQGTIGYNNNLSGDLPVNIIWQPR